MALRLNGSTSGYVELNAPAVAGSTSLTIPFGILKVEESTTYSTTGATSSSTFSDTGLSASFTPSAAGSSILVYVYHGQSYKDASDTQLEVKLLRGTTQVGNVWHGLNNNGSVRDTNNCHFFTLDTPTYTLGNSITYKTQFRNRDAAGTVSINGGGAYMVFLEVAA